MGEGLSISLIGITFPWYLNIGTLVMSQFVKQCITVDLFPHILANDVDIHLFLHTPLVNRLVVSQSVNQCITVDLFPHILANDVDIHLFLHTPLLNKTPWLSSARMFVRLYRLLLIHCIYVSVIKPTCPAFSAWLNNGAIRSMKVSGKDIMLCS